MEVVVASGKGGTGKTFVSSNLSLYLEDRCGKVIGVDADVEAPDLLIALGGARRILWKEDFYGSKLPVVDYSKCTRCWKCVRACEFSAMSVGVRGPVVDRYKCEGLGTCALVCPVGAISLEDIHTGVIYAAESNSGITVITGDLDLGQGSSGRLVYEIKEKAYKLAGDLRARYRVVDAAPGIGCPVVSSIAGSDLLIVVVEPTPQSIKGAKRLLKVAEILNVESVALVNKYDLEPDTTKGIVEDLGVEVIGLIPYDEEVVRSYTLMQPLLLHNPYSKAARALLEAFSTVEWS